MARRDLGEHVGVRRKPLPRRVVECQQAAVHQGCGRRAQDVRGERLLLRTGLEDGTHPHLGGQRQRQPIGRGTERRLRRPVEMIEDGTDDGLPAHASDRHRRLKRSPDDVDEELSRVGMSGVVHGLADRGEAAGQRHRGHGRLAGAVLRSRRAGRHDDAEEDGEESASANGLTHEQPRGSELIYTGCRTCRRRWDQPRGRYSAPGDKNYKVNLRGTADWLSRLQRCEERLRPANARLHVRQIARGRRHRRIRQAARGSVCPCRKGQESRELPGRLVAIERPRTSGFA